MDVIIFTTNNSPHYESHIELYDLPKLSRLPLEKLFIGYSDFDWSNVMRFDFFDLTFENDPIKLVMNVCYVPLVNKIYLEQNVLEKINSTKNAYLWLITPQEAKINEEELLKEIDQSSIKNEKVIVSTSNAEYSYQTINGVKFLGFEDWFESYYSHQIKHFSNVSYIDHDSKKITLKNATKKFICLNRNVREHRFWTYATLLQSPALNEGHVSYHLPKIDDVSKNDFEIMLSNSINLMDPRPDKKIIKQLYLSKDLDVLDNQSIINNHEGIIPFYHDSLFSIVTESSIEEQFLTEKTFKAMAHCQPFVIVGNPRNIDRLKLKGYNTFEDIFEVDAITTPQQLKEFLDRVHKIPLEEWRIKISNIWDRVRHNYIQFLHFKNSFNTFKTNIIKLTESDRSSNSFCMAPWVHISVWPNGDAYPCCVYDYNTPIGNVNEQGIKAVWNSDNMRQLRLDLMANKRPEGCKRCHILDDAKIFSYRRKITEDYKHHRPLISKTKKDGALEKINLAYFDIRFSNLCNMKCRSCGPHFSSKWSEDIDGKPKIIEINNENIWSEIEDYIESVEEIYFTGGESLFQEQHYRLLDMIIAKNVHPKLVYNSNGSRLEFKGKNVLDYWNKIKNRIEFQISLDQLGSKAEFTRHGQPWNIIDKNLRYIKKNAKNVIIIPNPTISVLNILDLKEIIEYLFDNDISSDYNINLNNILITPEWLNIQILPYNLKELAQSRLNEFKDSLKKYKMDSRMHEYYVTNIPRIISKMWEKDESRRINDFKIEMQKLDELRKEKFVDVYPELKDLYD